MFGGRRTGDQVKHFSGDGAFEAAQDVFFALACCGESGRVGAGAGIGG